MFLHRYGNQEFVPTQPLYLPSYMVEKKTAAVMIEAQLTATITAKGETYTYPLLSKYNVTNTE